MGGYVQEWVKGINNSLGTCLQGAIILRAYGNLESSFYILQRLPILLRTESKLLVRTFKALNDAVPDPLSDLSHYALLL